MADPSPADVNLDRHIPALDGLRGLAIALVMILHFTVMETNDVAALKWLSVPINMGWAGVDLFFVLSGFLITGILIKARERPNYYRNFYARRALRIFPLYYAFLIVVLGIVPLSGAFEDHANFWWVGEAHRAPWVYWVYLGNIRAGLEGEFQNFFLSVTWSLAIEEHFYLLWPFLVARAGTLKRLAWTCAILAAGSALLRAASVSLGLDSMAAYTWTPLRLDGLALGALLAALVRLPRGTEQLARIARMAWAPLLVAVGVLVAARIALGVRPQGIHFDPWMQTLGYPLVNALFGAMLLLAVLGARTGWLRRLLETEWMRWLGKYSYAMYLFNMPVRWMLETFAVDVNDVDSLSDRLLVQAGYYPAGIALTAGAAWISWRVLEQPFLRVKDRFRSVPPPG